MPKKAVNQLGLFDEPEEQGGLEKAVSDNDKNSVQEPQEGTGLNLKDQKHPYAIKRGYLNGFDYDTLRNIFYGMHQVKVPEAILSSMNPVEILALYFGIQRYKEGEKVAGKTFEEIVSKLVSKAMKSSSELTYQHYRSNKIYTTKKNDMKRRMLALDDGTKAAFLNSLTASKKFSDGEYEMYGMRGRDFHDPNCDGKNKGLYIRGIMGKLKA